MGVLNLITTLLNLSVNKVFLLVTLFSKIIHMKLLANDPLILHKNILQCWCDVAMK